MVTEHPIHGGPDEQGVPLHDFSTNSNACGPCPQALSAVQSCDASRYPDPTYTAVRQQLADFHGVQAWRVVLAGGASEFIYRITAWVAQARRGAAPASVWFPVHAYRDYAHAAQAWGCLRSASVEGAQLAWACEPSSPLGRAHMEWPRWLLGLPLEDGQEASRGQASGTPHATMVIDCAYAPLRLSGAPTLSPIQMDRVWQIWTPNKALGLTGVRAAYAIAPLDAESVVLALNALAPSWVVGAHGVALLQAWVQPEVQAWLGESLHTLRCWKAMQIDMLSALGWTCLPSDANFFCAHPPLGEAGDPERMAWAAALLSLRHMGIKLRDAASFGLPGQARLGVMPPVAQQALHLALIHINQSAYP